MKHINNKILNILLTDGAVGSSAATSPLFAMSGDGKNDVELPMVFLFHKEGSSLLTELEKNPDLEVYIGKTPQDPSELILCIICIALHAMGYFQMT